MGNSQYTLDELIDNLSCGDDSYNKYAIDAIKDLRAQLAAAEKMLYKYKRPYERMCMRYERGVDHGPNIVQLVADVESLPPKPASGTEQGQRGGE